MYFPIHIFATAPLSIGPTLWSEMLGPLIYYGDRKLVQTPHNVNSVERC